MVVYRVVLCCSIQGFLKLWGCVVWDGRRGVVSIFNL